MRLLFYDKYFWFIFGGRKKKYKKNLFEEGTEAELEMKWGWLVELQEAMAAAALAAARLSAAAAALSRPWKLASDSLNLKL